MITGKAKLAGVIGWPISHSRSPQLHNSWLQALDLDGAYVPLAVAPDNLSAAVTGLRAAGFAGLNVTIPHKEAAFALATETTARAQAMGAANTLVFTENGILADNTDGYGFLQNLLAARPNWSAKTGPAMILGAGGAARAVVGALAEAGCPQLRLVNRSRDRAAALVEDLSARMTLPPVEIMGWADAPDRMQDCALLVNSSSLGMTGQPDLSLSLAKLPRTAVVTDLVYVPLETTLLATARARGNPVVDDLGMLLHQGRPG
ncbi:MAG: shikimate dehydrogenase, partial [Rhodospirillaceae bacterium]